jgi:2-polyprenyl-3-methyl-5-hydroxy-6-metoxy-1,4-benzoquinol methylase
METDALRERLFRSALGAYELFTIYVGERLGLYAALADGAATTPPSLAERTGTTERTVREWLEQQAACGFLMVDDPDAEPVARRYRLPPEHVPVLADRDDVRYEGYRGVESVRVARPMPEIVETFRTGKGPPPLPWEPEGRAELNRPLFLTLLGREWLPAIPAIDRRLTAEPPARVADIACGTGWSSIAMALAYPSIVVHGFDLDPDAIGAARRNAEATGVADRVTYAAVEASEAGGSDPYDLVTIFEALHDMTRPVEVLRAVREMLGPDGSVLVADERVDEAFTASASEQDRYVYAVSVIACLPYAMNDPETAATGAMMRAPTVVRYATEAGFREVEILPIETDSWRFYRLVP